MKKPFDVIAGLRVGSRASGCVLSGFTPPVSRVTSLWSEDRSDSRYLPTALVIIASFALSACATPPSVVTETIRVPVYIPAPATLTAPVQVTLLPGVTYGEALGKLNAGLQTCNGQLQSIATLKPPGKPY